MKAAVVIGGAGTGKTTELLRLMEATLQKEVRDPMRIGFVSFTRAARSEAATRASDKFGIPVSQLEQNGWFRTIHSICHRVLGVGDELLAGTAESKQWTSEAIGEQITTSITSIDGDISEAFEVSSKGGRCLHIWDVARAMLVPVSQIWEWHNDIAPTSTPDLNDVIRIISAYEDQKKRDGRCDFTDLLLRVAGKNHRIEFIEDAIPEGTLPILPVWFFDEQQDTSKLADLVCRRLILGAKWIYLVGDPFQSIYGWAGAEARHFMSWTEESKRRILDRSFRCPSAILEAGESILRPCNDYFDRMIKPNEEGGIITEESFLSGWEQEIDPRDSWLVLARTNRLAYKAGQLLDSAGIPWGSTQGAGAKSPVKAAAIGAMFDLENGGVIDGRQWQQIIKVFPSNFEGIPLLERGTKKRFEDDSFAGEFSFITADRLGELGASTALVSSFKWKTWRDFVPECHHLVQCCERWGADVLINPKIRIGTIHSAKGAEADSVAVLTTQTAPIRTASLDPRGADEERRVWYVAATRARKRLMWLHDYRDRMRFNPN